MALSVTKHENAFKYKLVQETACTNSAITNVCDTSGFIHSITVINGQSSSASLKVFDSDTMILGSTLPVMVYRIPASSTTVIEIPDGMPFTYLSFACTNNPNPIDTTVPSGGTVTVRFLVSSLESSALY